MNIREAILRTADHIERHPRQFNFMSFGIPNAPGCGTPGCALGWINTFLGFKQKELNYGLDTKLAEPAYLGCDATVFYERMETLTGGSATAKTWGLWSKRAALCAQGLRLYADAYHPAPIVMPDWNALASEPLPVAERASALI